MAAQLAFNPSGNPTLVKKVGYKINGNLIVDPPIVEGPNDMRFIGLLGKGKNPVTTYLNENCFTRKEIDVEVIN